jgi:LuxR family maltose regulon positive regulatory protein
MLAMAQGRYEDAAAAWRAGERLASELRATHYLAALARQWQLRAQLRLGDDGPAREALEQPGETAEWHSLAAHVALLDGDPERAADAVAPVLDGVAFAVHVNLEIEAHLLDALARHQCGDVETAHDSLERALALAEPHGRVWAFLTVPGARDLLADHPVHRTAHAAHLKALLDHLSGIEPPDDPGAHLADPLSERELSVLRFLPTNLSAAEIGNELYLSVHTVKTHMRKLYAKLDVHTRAEAVQRGRALGLLAPATR